VTHRWTKEEDANWGKKHKTNWAAVAALFPGRTEVMLRSDVMKSSIDGTSAGSGIWTKAENSKLKSAVQTYGSKNCAAAVLVLGRIQK
jgi:hypothetical protein